MDDQLATEMARHERRFQRGRLIALVVVAAVLTGGWLLYRDINGYPGDHGFEHLTVGDGYSPEIWECVIDIFEAKPLAGTLFGQFVVEAVHNERADFTGFKVDAAFGSEKFQIGDGNLIYYAFNGFRTYAKLRDCSDSPFQ